MDDRKQLPGNLTATQMLIAVNGAVFLIAAVLLSAQSAFSRSLPLYLPENEQFRAWQFVTSMFMHANFSHLLMNMFGLFMFGSALERIWGEKRFLLFYFAVGLGAGLIYSGVTTYEYHAAVSALVEQGFDASVLDQVGRFADPREFLTFVQRQHAEGLTDDTAQSVADVFYAFHTPVVGASGAIYGILTAFGLLFPNAKLALIFLPIPVAAKYFIPALLLMDFFSGITGFSIFGGGIAHFAHLGGALIGFLLMMLWRNRARRRMPESQTLRFTR